MSVIENERPMKLDEQMCYDMGYKQGKVDAVVHGRWLERGSPWTTLWNCSVCGKSPQISSQETDYCPHCGAEME